MMELPKVVKTLVNAYATVVMAGKKTIEEVPETYTLAGIEYPLRELVDIEVAERIIAKLGQA